METALVTGGTAGIGRAIAFALGKAGYRVGVCSRSGKMVEETLLELRALGIEAAGIAADVGQEGEVRAAVEHVTRELGPVDVVVNNAGIAVMKPFDQLSLDDWDSMYATNLRGMVLVTREVLPGMRQRKRGSIINISSLAGKNGFVGGTGYAASKHAVMGFSKSLMLEVRADNIRVIVLCPGSVDTSLLHQQGGNYKAPARMLEADDVAETLLAALRLPVRAMVSELDIRPTNP